MVILKPSTRFGHHTSHHRVIYKHVKYIEQIESWGWFGTLLLLGLFYEPPDGALIGETKLPHSCTWWQRLACPAKGPKCTSDKDCPGQSKCCLHTCGAYCTARVPSHQGNELQHDFFNFNDIQKKVGFGNLRFLQEILAVTSLSNSMQTMFVAIFSGHKKCLKCGMWNAGFSRLWHHFSLNTFGGVLCHPALLLERGKKKHFNKIYTKTRYKHGKYFLSLSYEIRYMGMHKLGANHWLSHFKIYLDLFNRFLCRN